MFILLSLFLNGLAIIFGWLTIIFMGALLFLPELLYIFCLLGAVIVMVVFTVICACLGFTVFLVVWGWVVGLVCWGFGLIGWIFGKRETKVVVREPKKVRFDEGRGKVSSGCSGI
ncbi:hypothetical protein NA56DRAFT_47051 [Hyaloscypha hepaticicola]|uniref:Uncharacterized protein n=1 Tax=Hyaloscypha hepaticicola TaxID=2082293 RepID=A0A2J6QBT0_9HELO|nr:hypothetical protein NA56DRAFT_47051 [Hyaloscypha hepaticicola]